MTSPLPNASRARTIVPWALGALLILGVAAFAWVGVRGALAYSHLQSARAGLVSAVQSADDSGAAAAALPAVQEDLRAAHDLTSDPVWNAVELLPWIGPQLAAVGDVATAAAEVADSALEPLSAVATDFSLSAFRPVNGAVDLTALTSMRDAATNAASGLESATATLAKIDRAPLLRPVRAGVDDIEDQFAAAISLTRAVTLLPSMLGADGPRTWLLLFQNNAELRSLGGMPGATAVVTAANGSLALTGQGTARMPRFDEPVVDLGEERFAIYGERPAVWFSGTTIVPDFTAAAPAAREMWRLAHGLEADGVISLDPFALSYLLRATGSITLPTGEVLTSENVVDVLLNRIYFDYPDPEKQNEVYASATASIFDAFMSGDAEPAQLILALAQAAGERRLLLWSNVADEQALFEDSRLGGQLPASDEETARFGVYLNDGTGSKLGYYLDVDANVRWDSCQPNGLPAGNRATLTLNLTHTAPADAATSLPDSIAGGYYGVPAGTLRVVTYIYLPGHATLADATGSPAAGFGGGFDGDSRALSHVVDLNPGDSATLSVTATLAPTDASSIAAELTPAFGPTTVSFSCASGGNHTS